MAGRSGALWLTAALAVLSTSGLGCGEPSVVFPGRGWQTRAPAELGLDGSALDRFVAGIGSSRRDAGVIVKDGFVVKTWGNPSARIDWDSAGKAVLSTMLLFALQEGRMSSFDDPVVDWGWDVSGVPAATLQGKDRAITFHHLANMTSGLDRVEGPGEAYAYNDNAVQLYARTLLRVFDAQTPRPAFNDEALDPARLGSLQSRMGPCSARAIRYRRTARKPPWSPVRATWPAWAGSG